MVCEHVQAALSGRMDGEVSPMRPGDAEHARTCPRCLAFADRAARVRQAVRFEVAEPVPDLVAPIMARVRAEARTVRSLTTPRGRRVRTVRGPSRWTNAGRVAVAVLAGAVAGAAIMSGGLVLRREPRLAEASEVPALVFASAPMVTSYSAGFDITERGWRPDVAVRTFRADVEFQAPEAFRIEVRDLTAYPASLAGRNHHSLRVLADRWSLVGPQACPAAAAPTCGPAPPVERSITGRAPFDADAPMPTDGVLPVIALAGSDRVTVLGPERVLDRDAVRVRAPAEQVAPLFDFFQQAGSWRPQYPSDPVDVWLDREAWLPLRFVVASAGGADRDAWTAANGIAPEPAGTVVLRAEVTTFSLNEPLEEPPESWFSGSAPAAAADRGFVEASGQALTTTVGFSPLEPSHTAGLSAYRTGAFRGTREAVLSYATGLAWLRVHQTRTHREPALFGNVGLLAERVALPNGGVGFYEPAGTRAGRRLSVHADGWDLFLESNLPRADLLRVAGSIPVTGLDPPPSWRTRTGPGGLRIERVSLDEASRRSAFTTLALPRRSLDRLDLAGTLLSSSNGLITGVTTVYRRPGFEAYGYALRLHQAPGQPLPPPTGTDQVQVEVRRLMGRWSPTRHELEWVEDGVYRSVAAPGLDLAAVLDLVAKLEPV